MDAIVDEVINDHCGLMTLLLGVDVVHNGRDDNNNMSLARRHAINEVGVCAVADATRANNRRQHVDHPKHVHLEMILADAEAMYVLTKDKKYTRAAIGTITGWEHGQGAMTLQQRHGGQGRYCGGWRHTQTLM